MKMTTSTFRRQSRQSLGLFRHQKPLLLTAMMAVLLCQKSAYSFTSKVVQSSVPSSTARLFARRAPSARRTSSSGRRGPSSSAGPKGGSGGRPRERAPRKRAPASFEGKSMSAAQSPNERAPPLDLASPSVKDRLHCMTDNMQWENTPAVTPQTPFQFHSLNEVLGVEGFSETFNADKAFRVALRAAIRQDIFDTTPFYAGLPEKAAAVLLLPDSSLEGSWRKPTDLKGLRMKQTTNVLRKYLDEETSNEITGDDIMDKIGALCGSKPSTHFIDIFGVQDREINHSWHQDFGQSPEDSRTVLWGFPNDDDYVGCGVFSHVVSLKQECLAPPDHPRMEPVLFKGKIDDKYIIRPEYRPGREIITYRDIDVLHSAPDVTYRMNLMRFM